MLRVLIVVGLLASVCLAEQQKSGADLLRDIEKKNGTDQATLKKKAKLGIGEEVWNLRRDWSLEDSEKRGVRRDPRSPERLEQLRKNAEAYKARNEQYKRDINKWRGERDAQIQAGIDADNKARADYEREMRPYVMQAELNRQKAEYESYLRSQEPPSVIVVPVAPGPVRQFKSGREAQRAGYYDGYYDQIYWGAYRGW